VEEDDLGVSEAATMKASLTRPGHGRSGSEATGKALRVYPYLSVPCQTQRDGVNYEVGRVILTESPSNRLIQARRCAPPRHDGNARASTPGRRGRLSRC